MTLLHSESFSTRSEAACRERYYKTGRGRDELDSFDLERSLRRQVAGSNPVAPTMLYPSDNPGSSVIGSLRNTATS
jgi:hypothetical protein